MGFLGLRALGPRGEAALGGLGSFEALARENSLAGLACQDESQSARGHALVAMTTASARLQQHC